MSSSCYKNTTLSKSSTWEDLAQTTFINIVLFTMMMVSFAIVRRKAWNNRSRQLTRTHRGWLQFIYGDREMQFTNTEKRKMADPHHHDTKKQGILVPPSFTGYVGHTPESEEDNPQQSKEEFREKMPLETWRTRSNKGKEYNTDDIERQERKTDYFAAKDHLTRSMSTESVIQFGYWVLDVLLIRDKEIARLKGIDAVQYLTFQRYIIYFLLFLTFACMFIVLPVNMLSSGGHEGFQQTSIGNIGDDNLRHLYLHLGLSMALLLVGWLVMRHFAHIINTEDEKVSGRTLFVQRIPKSKLVKTDIESFVSTNVPDIKIDGIQFVYDTRVIKALYSEYFSVKNAKYYCEEYLAEFRERFEGRPYTCGQWLGFLCCCYCFPKVDGLAYYDEKIRQLEKDIEKNHAICMTTPTGAMFITLESEEAALSLHKFVLQQHEFRCFYCFDYFVQLVLWLYRSLIKRKVGDFGVHQWEVAFAPYPDDINWDDIAVDFRMVWLRRIGVNLWLFLIFFFFSTPAIVSDVLAQANIEQKLSDNVDKFSPIVKDYIPALIMMLTSLILPTIVAVSSYFLPYTTISERDYSVMWKTFLFLILMNIVIPSLGFASIQRFLHKIANEQNGIGWDCIFQYGSQNLQINYVVQSALLGNAMELLRFPELFLYLFHMNFSSQTVAEYEFARQQVIFDFSFGLRYPKFLLIFCVVVTYSLSVPLIAPCGLVYMIFKHLIDRYNIYYVYTPSRIPGSIHSAAMMFFYISLLLMQLQLFAYVYSKTSGTDKSDLVLTALFGLLLAVLLVLYHCFNRWFASLHICRSLKKRTATKHKVYQEDWCACAYAPDVLYDLYAQGIVAFSSGSHSKELLKSKHT